MILCIMFSGQPIDDLVSNTLLRAAQQMYKERKDFLSIASDFMEGQITTEGRTVMFGSAAGVAFDANVAWDGGTTTVKYLVTSRELADYRE